MKKADALKKKANAFLVVSEWDMITTELIYRLEISISLRSCIYES